MQRTIIQKRLGRFGTVVTLEVIEHVLDPEAFVRECVGAVQDGGVVVISTMNRTPWSFFANIVAAEHLLGLVPTGTHDWSQFLSPGEILDLLSGAARSDGRTAELIQCCGITPGLTRGRLEFRLCGDVSSHFILAAQIHARQKKATE